MDCSPPGSSVLYAVEFPRQNTRVGCHFLLQGIFWTPGIKQCLVCSHFWGKISSDAGPSASTCSFKQDPPGCELQGRPSLILLTGASVLPGGFLTCRAWAELLLKHPYRAWNSLCAALAFSVLCRGFCPASFSGFSVPVQGGSPNSPVFLSLWSSLETFFVAVR